MSQTNRIPLGFLDQVGAETGGKTPPQYSDVLVPSVDLSWLYLGQTLAAKNDTFSHTIIGQTVTFTVPSDEAWIIISCSFTETMQAASLIQWEFNINRQPRGSAPQTNGFPALWVSRAVTVATNGDIGSDAFCFPQPLVVHPGVQCRFRTLQRDAGAARTARLQLNVYQLKA